MISEANSFFPLTSAPPPLSPESFGCNSNNELKRILHCNVLNPISVFGCNPYPNGVSYGNVSICSKYFS